MRLFAVPAAFMMLATAAAADMPPPAGALPLSEVLAKLEAANQIQYVDDVDWDDDGYWDVEFISADGAKVKVKLDPLTGDPRQ